MTRRTRRNAARVLGLGLVAASLLLFAGTGSSSADTPAVQLTAKGWWWQAQQLPTTIPPPPNVSAGQLYVQGDPSGRAAFAAVHYAVNTADTATTLTLNVGTNGDQGGSSAVVLACRTGSAWTAAEAGAWSAAPKVDTSACVTGLRSADGLSWTFAVKTLQVGGVVDVAVVPGVDPTTSAASTFSLVFNGPSNDSLASQAGPPPTVAPISSKPSVTPAAGSSGASGTAPSTFQAPPPTPLATGVPTDKVGQTATAPAKQQATQGALDAQLASSPAKDRNKMPGYIVLAIAAAIGLYAWRQDNLMALNGGSLPGAPEEPGGLGRFAQPRQGQPPALT